MDINVGKEISGIDIYGSKVKGEITGISNILRIVTVKTGEDRLDVTTVSLDNIND
ncbi:MULTISPECIES: hypothetical protein [unclassified Clostridium]|uniref:hypothetical protein n=1 Tax=unclassified Clostridium TaxID=2614128 RepID=UPI0002976539|nr:MULTISPECIES: hypothetical protein [unclassified Clostridium]EKQ58228.1 MAG: hypothetical protein A370_00085 [Clostridium sp. Maddingley MBC34-26]